MVFPATEPPPQGDTSYRSSIPGCWHTLISRKTPLQISMSASASAASSASAATQLLQLLACTRPMGPRASKWRYTYNTEPSRCPTVAKLAHTHLSAAVLCRTTPAASTPTATSTSTIVTPPMSTSPLPTQHVPVVVARLFSHTLTSDSLQPPLLPGVQSEQAHATHHLSSPCIRTSAHPFLEHDHTVAGPSNTPAATAHCACTEHKKQQPPIVTQAPLCDLQSARASLFPVLDVTDRALLPMPVATELLPSPHQQQVARDRRPASSAAGDDHDSDEGEPACTCDGPICGCCDACGAGNDCECLGEEELRHLDPDDVEWFVIPGRTEVESLWLSFCPIHSLLLLLLLLLLSPPPLFRPLSLPSRFSLSEVWEGGGEDAGLVNLRFTSTAALLPSPSIASHVHMDSWHTTAASRYSCCACFVSLAA